MRVERRLLSLWALGAGITLWMPALGVPMGPIYLQPMDLMILAGLPLLAAFSLRLGTIALVVLAPMGGGIALTWATMGGQPLVLIWTLLFALPFVALVALVARDTLARHWLLRGVFIGATGGAALFLAQITLGAEVLDFRTNTAFRLPPHFGRGFALFPEVSTFATHAITAFAMALALLLHPATPRRHRRPLATLMGALALCLLFSRSTSVIVLAPVLTGVALVVTLRPTVKTLLLVMALATLGAVFLSLFVSAFYIDRMESASAERSAAMRLASILGGLSPLHTGEIFGVGIGENDQVALRAHAAARHWGLSFGQLPEGVNSQIIGRIFEEGWPALLHMLTLGALFLRHRRAMRARPETAALYVLAAGAMLTALLVTGYRGIYTNWLWLGLAALVLPQARARSLPRAAWA